jgi:hypothetical protein
MKRGTMRIRVDEKDLEDFLINNRENHKLWEENATVYRQFNLNQAGIADILTIETEAVDTTPIQYIHHFNVIELKVNTLSVADYVQMCRYVSYLRNYLLEHFSKIFSKDTLDYRVYGTLIGSGSSISTDLFYLHSCREEEKGLTIKTFNLHHSNGISFDDFSSSFETGNDSDKQAKKFYEDIFLNIQTIGQKSLCLKEDNTLIKLIH